MTGFHPQTQKLHKNGCNHYYYYYYYHYYYYGSTNVWMPRVNYYYYFYY